jgi:hypothetical protein
MAASPAAAIAIAIHEASVPLAEAPSPVFGSAAPAPALPAGRVAVAAGCVAATVFVGTSVFVGEGVADGVHVAVGVMVGVRLGVGVGVAVPVDVAVFVGVFVGVPVGVGVFVGVPVGVAVFVTVAVDVAVPVLVDVLVGTGVLVMVAVAVGVSPVQSAKATPRPPGKITRAAQATESASTRFKDFNMDGDPPVSGGARARLRFQPKDHTNRRLRPALGFVLRVVPNFSVSGADFESGTPAQARFRAPNAAARTSPPAAASAMLSHDIDALPAAPPPVRGSLVLPAVPPPGSVAVAGGGLFWIAGVDVAAPEVTNGAGVPVGLAVCVAPSVAVLVAGVFVG